MGSFKLVDTKDTGVNGKDYGCPLHTNWHKYEETFSKISDIHTGMTELKAENGPVERIATNIESMNTTLISAVTGKKQIPLDVALILIAVCGTVWLISIVKDSHKDVRLSWTDGLVISESK